MTTRNKFVKTIVMSFLKYFLLFSTLLTLGEASAAKTVGKVSAANRKITKCSLKKLELKDCHLEIAGNKIQVWNDKIFLNTKTDRDIQILVPNVEWIFVEAKLLAGRPLLELGLWATTAGESEVESLFWSVYEIKDDKLHLHLTKNIQKRKKVILGEASKAKYKYDRLAKYGLEIKNKKIQWHVGRDKGFLK
jgi:hypothetical protein